MDEQKTKVRCPGCGRAGRVPASFAGRKVKCPATGCGQRFLIPIPPEPDLEPEFELNLDRSPLDDEGPQAPATQPDYSTGTVASNPAGVRLDFLRWCRHKPLLPAIGIGSALLIFALWLGLTMAGAKASLTDKRGGEVPIWVFAPAGLLTVGLLMWRQMPNFGTGDANPGVVVALNPTLVAVPSDLTMGVGAYPVVKIIKANLTESRGEPLVIGSRLATIAQYFPPPDKESPHWSNFDPVPVDYATGDADTVRRLLASFPDKQYAFLQQALEQIEQPYQPGLYVFWEAPGKPMARRIQTIKDF